MAETLNSLFGEHIGPSEKLGEREPARSNIPGKLGRTVATLILDDVLTPR